MGNWRRQRGRSNYNQPEIMQQQGTRSKPPLSNWKRSVPAWEKNFCSTVGLVPWGKVLEAKQSMYLYENVAKWNDSAGEEAFKNAKARFWAEINGLPCDISLPDPDIYIDDVDWNAEVDPELILDLEHDTNPAGETTEGEHVVILDTSLLRDQYTLGWGTGWGDEDAEGINKTVDTEQQTGHHGWNTGIPESSWGQNHDGWNDDTWRGGKTDSWDQNHDGWNDDSWRGGKTGSWDQNHDGWNDDSWGKGKADSWDQNDNGWNDDSWGKGKTDSCDQNHDRWKDDSWGKGKTESWDHTNSSNSHRRNVNSGDGGRRKRAEGQEGWWGKDGHKSWRVHREDNVEDCRRRNGRGRRRGSFQNHSNSRFWTETF
ncbi:PREDICTED: aspartate and glycine-rich protein [Tarenaya hassleriana]|uniref:aspartate and glycine-rich protein n=1 Tax=Tarenaya hassleriana TaxID=28532 RepID=UPI00053C9CD3|nr:PREDICTED: aspartate and glycine-rich protein [Tarenaya hassleriana]